MKDNADYINNIFVLFCGSKMQIARRWMEPEGGGVVAGKEIFFCFVNNGLTRS